MCPSNSNYWSPSNGKQEISENIMRTTHSAEPRCAKSWIPQQILTCLVCEAVACTNAKEFPFLRRPDDIY